MTFLEKHYPEIGQARNILENRLRQLEYRNQLVTHQTQHNNQILHTDHHRDLQSNIIHLYDLVRQTAENQSQIQKQMKYMRNKSVGNLSIHQIEHRQRVHHLENAYRKAQEKAYSLSRRIQTYYPKHLKRQYHSRFDRYPMTDIHDEIVNKKEQLQEDLKRTYQRKLYDQNRYNIQQRLQLQELNNQRQMLNKLIQQQTLNRKCLEENIKLKQTFYSLNQNVPTGSFQYPEDKYSHSRSIDHQSRHYPVLYSPKSNIYQQNPVNKTIQNEGMQNSKVGKIYQRHTKKQSQNRNNDTQIQQPINILTKDNSIINDTKIVHETYDSIDNNNILIDQNNDQQSILLSRNNKSIAHQKTRPNNSDLTNSISQSRFKPKTKPNYNLDYSQQQSQQLLISKNDQQLDGGASVQNSKSKSIKSKSPYKLMPSVFSKSNYKLSGIMKKRYQAQNQQLICSNAMKRINDRIQKSYAIFQDPNLKNVKYQESNLLNRYNLQSKLKKQMREKLSKHHIAQKKYGLV